MNISCRFSLRSIVPIFIPFLTLALASGQAASTTATLAISPASPASSGTVVTLTATVLSGTTPVNPGQVEFCDATAAHCDNSALLATAQLTATGIATYKFRPGVGSHSYQAVFIGTSSYATSKSSAVALIVTGPYPTTTTIASAGSVGNYTLTATVVGTGSSYLSPTGNVSFLDTTNGNAVLGTAALGTAELAESFATTSMPDVGSSPRSVVVGDFNGDGMLDLAVANSGDDTVTVLLGNGDGTFTTKSTPGVGSNPVSVAVGDFNGDVLLDLAVANSGDNTVTVLLGNGDGTFTTKSTPGVGTGPDFIAVGDFNGDGIPDLAVANGGVNTVSVLLGNGDGTFSSNLRL